uniref:Uncharacterized protein n=1 Tax=Eutreptiella gymnastica TaxID=73025 RepID=A0A7S4FX29_9EUGL
MKAFKGGAPGTRPETGPSQTACQMDDCVALWVVWVLGQCRHRTARRANAVESLLSQDISQSGVCTDVWSVVRRSLTGRGMFHKSKGSLWLFLRHLDVLHG